MARRWWRASMAMSLVRRASMLVPVWRYGLILIRLYGGTYLLLLLLSLGSGLYGAAGPRRKIVSPILGSSVYLGTGVPTLDGSSGRGMLCARGAARMAASARALRLSNKPSTVRLVMIGLPHAPALGDSARGVGNVQWSSVQIGLLTGAIESILRLSAALVSGMLSFSCIMGNNSQATARSRDVRPRDDIVAGVIL